MRKRAYLFRRAPRKRISSRTLWLGLVGTLAIAPPAFAQIPPAPSANPSIFSIGIGHRLAPSAASEVCR